jgi:two-component system chemotaxis family response regulator WspR
MNVATKVSAHTTTSTDGVSSTTSPGYPVVVLLVDDQPMVGEAVRRALLGEVDVEFRYCSDPHEAVAMANDVNPTVILQDLVMPGVDGIELVRRYRENASTKGTPIIVLSTKEEPSVKSDAFRAGANDYLVKLPDQIELIARIRYHSMAYLTQRQRDEAYRALHESQQKLLETNRELQRLTNVDGLTGLSNRRYFNERIDAEWSRAQRAQSSLSILMIDVDHFKLYNDTYGHLAGDDVLKAVAQTIEGNFKRPADLAARYGGEEFSVILPETAADDLQSLAGRLCGSVASLNIPHTGSSSSTVVTISVGGASTVPQRDESFAALIERADKALYEAKKAGRNRAVTHGLLT